jgi:hypothetical protein
MHIEDETTWLHQGWGWGSGGGQGRGQRRRMHSERQHGFIRRSLRLWCKLPRQRMHATQVCVWFIKSKRIVTDSSMSKCTTLIWVSRPAHNTSGQLHCTHHALLVLLDIPVAPCGTPQHSTAYPIQQTFRFPVKGQQPLLIHVSSSYISAFICVHHPWHTLH